MKSFAHSSNVFNLPEGQNASCLSAVLADTENHRFVIGSTSLKKACDVHLVSYSEEHNRISCESILPQPRGEIWSIAASPYSKDIFAAGHSRGQFTLF